MTGVKFLDLQAPISNRSSRRSTRRCCSVLASSTYVLGPEVEAFEQRVRRGARRGRGVAVNSGTSALHLALLAAGIGPGDEVITPSMTFTATAAAIAYTGATPVFVDVDPDELHDRPGSDRGEDHAAHQGDHPRPPLRPERGHAADDGDRGEARADRSSRTRRRRILRNIKGRQVGRIGHIGCFSFYPGQESWRLWGGRAGDDLRSRARAQDAAASRLGAGAANTTTNSRL